MKYSKGKYQVLHLGWSNVRYKHRLGDVWPENSSLERDLGVLVYSRLNTSQQRALAAKTTNCIFVH